MIHTWPTGLDNSNDDHSLNSNRSRSNNVNIKNSDKIPRRKTSGRKEAVEKRKRPMMEKSRMRKALKRKRRQNLVRNVPTCSSLFKPPIPRSTPR